MTFLSENMHDCVVLGQRFDGGSYVMDIDCSGGFCDVIGIHFLNAQIHRVNGFPNKTIWLHDEQFKDGEDFIIHIYGRKAGRKHECVIKTSGVLLKRKEG